jgi:tetratricopeptide (TPR) repeat protein
LLYYENERYTDAELLFKRCLAINEKIPGPDNLKVANSLNDLVALYEAQARYAEAEPLIKRSLAVQPHFGRQIFGFDVDHSGQRGHGGVIAAALFNLIGQFCPSLGHVEKSKFAAGIQEALNIISDLERIGQSAKQQAAIGATLFT